MSKVLVIIGTVSNDEISYSKALLNSFLNEYKKHNANDEFTFLDLNNDSASQMNLNIHNFAESFNEENSLKYIKQLKGVDKVIMVSPMHNFNVSGLIKNYLDHVLLANETFSYKYSKKGEAIGLLTHLKVQILTTQGAPFGWYLFGNHTKFLEGTWNFMGTKVMEPILLAGTKVAPLNALKPDEAANTLIEEIKIAASKF